MVVLLDERLRPTLERRNFVGWKLCDEHEKLWEEGYIALIECTGQIAHVRREAWPNIFSVPAPNGPVVFVQEGVIERLHALTPKE